MHLIHWFRRDLRLTDNPALSWAAARASSLSLVFIAAPEEEDWPWGAASRWWLQKSLGRLQEQLVAQGQRLILLRGPSQQALTTLAHETGATGVSWNRLYEPATITRDTQIKQALQAAGLEVYSANAQLLHEPWQLQTRTGNPYRVFTPYWRRAREKLCASPIAPPPQLPPPAEGPTGLALEDLAISPTDPWTAKLAGHWQPGEQAGLRRLEDFADQAAQSYSQTRDRPDQAGTSRISPHLHWGEIGPRQVLAACAQLPLDDPFFNEIGWREFAHHLLYHFPQCLSEPLNPRFAAFPWQDPDPELLRRWQRGETGIDIVDAGMRQLWETGWMHNRVRMLTASLLCKNLGMHWLHGARWFWDTLVDADLANNTLGWQWVAGCGADAAPYFRIFNPATQAEKFDPVGDYRRQWLPASRPEPIIDLKHSRALALERYASTRTEP